MDDLEPQGLESETVVSRSGLKIGVQKRTLSFERAVIDPSTRTLSLSFSSELPVDRWFGSEVLSHVSGAADLTRLNDGAPLLFNHNPDAVIGVVENASIIDGRGIAEVRFAQSADGIEMQQLVDDGIIRNVSFGYQINEMSETEPGVFTASDWTPYEISLVSIPADPSIGIGRSDDQTETPETIVLRASTAIEAETNLTLTKDNIMDTTVEISAAANNAVEAERARIKAIRSLGTKHNMGDLAESMIDNGRSIDDARTAVLEKIGATQQPIDQNSGNVDMSERQQREYSVVRAINAVMSNDWKNAGFEREISAELAKKSGKDTNGFFMPLNIRAAYSTASAGTGGNIVATNLLAGSFIEALYNKAQIMNLGPTLLTGLVGNVAIPRQNAQTATYWVAENSAITEAEATFDQITLSAKQLGARSQYSRLMLQQSTPDIEMVVRNDLARVMALGLDAAAINGTGSSGQPTGILNQSGIGSVAMGTNGAAFVNGSTSSPSGLDQVIQLERSVDVANALDGSLYYLANAKVVSALKQLKNTYGEYLWQMTDDDTTAGTQGKINGFPVARSNQVPSNLTKGSGTALSALIFGDFSSLVIGMWGALEILPNPYGSGYTAGAVDIRAMQTVDIGVRHPESFAAIKDIIA